LQASDASAVCASKHSRILPLPRSIVEQNFWTSPVHAVQRGPTTTFPAAGASDVAAGGFVLAPYSAALAITGIRDKTAAAAM
jgi:hypothetical protein